MMAQFQLLCPKTGGMPKTLNEEIVPLIFSVQQLGRGGSEGC